MECEFCERRINNKGSLIAHQKTCKDNPNKISYGRSPKAGKQKGCESWNKGLKNEYTTLRFRTEYPNEKIFVEHSTYARHSLKKRILDDELIEYMCSVCKIGPNWMGKPMPLILDHKNGINNDNRLENLRFVCSNCDTQLPTYKSKNRGGGGKVSNEI